MDRTATLRRVDDERDPWDVLVVGGGATGLGVAVDSASRGYRTLLLEQHDFAKGTSSRSTKLIHGGVRYLRQGNVSLVLEALRERGILRRNAPHLVHDLPFVVPSYDWWESPFYGIGLRLYDLLAGKEGFGASRTLSREETLEQLPTLETEGLRGGVLYYDGQFDDARLAICLARTAADHGAAVINRMAVEALVKEDGLVRGVVARDVETGVSRELRAKVVVNATGAWADGLRRLDDAERVAAHPSRARACTSCSTGASIPATRRSWCRTPTTGACCSRSPGTAASWSAPPTRRSPRRALEPRPLAHEIEFLLRTPRAT